MRAAAPPQKNMKLPVSYKQPPKKCQTFFIYLFNYLTQNQKEQFKTTKTLKTEKLIKQEKVQKPATIIKPKHITNSQISHD